MPLFLQALPLSLKTLWRYLFLLPFLTALTIAVTLAAALIPIIGLIVPGVMSVLCTLAGLRCALKAAGHDSDLDLGKLVRASFWYFVLGIVVGLVVTALIVGLGMVAALTDGGGAAAQSNDSPIGGGILAIGGLATVLAYLLLMCAMAVPMTAAAATATIRGTQSDIFWGFGSGVISLAIVSVLGFLGNAAIFLAFHQVIGLFVILESDVSDLGQTFLALPHLEIVIPVMIGSILFAIWTTCWFFATAVLAWEREKAGHTAQVRQAASAPRVSAEDLRALRESRMRDR